MKILHVITGLNVGGAENMLCKLLENGSESGTEQAVLSLLEPGPLAERVRATQTPLHTLGMRSRIPGAGDAVRLTRLVRSIAPDLLHGWMYHGNLAASFARATSARRIPLIWNVRHSLADPSRESRKTQAILKLSAALSRTPATIIYNSSNAAAEHERAGYSAERRRIIPNGFDFDIYRPSPERRGWLCDTMGIEPRATIVGNVARYHPMKNHALLVDAVAQARAAGHDLHLVMIGAGVTQAPELAERIGRLLPADRVTLAEARSDLPALVPGFDMLAVSSSWGEGFPNVIGEALACEVPVVTTDVGDSAGIVADNGLVVQPGDAGAFADALGQMNMLGPQGRAAMGRAGRARTRGLYSIGEISRRYVQVYETVLREKSAVGHLGAAAGKSAGVYNR